MQKVARDWFLFGGILQRMLASDSHSPKLIQARRVILLLCLLETQQKIFQPTNACHVPLMTLHLPIKLCHVPFICWQCHKGRRRIQNMRECANHCYKYNAKFEKIDHSLLIIILTSHTLFSFVVVVAVS